MKYFFIYSWKIFLVVLITGCSNFQYVDLKDTTEKEWREITAQKKTKPSSSLPKIKVIRVKKVIRSEQQRKKAEYKSPLAGSALEVNISGGKISAIPGMPLDLGFESRKINIENRSRSDIAAINLGFLLISPHLGLTITPLGAFFYKKHWYDDRRRFRAVFAGVVNFLDFADGTWNDSGLEVLLHWENNTVPVGRREIIESKDVEFTDIESGYLQGGIGIGWRTTIAPHHYDNDFRVQLFYEPKYFYSKSTRDTGASVIFPPDTPIHQLRLSLSLDALERNFVELPHKGWAAGANVIIGRRERWSDHQLSSKFSFSRSDTRDYLRATAYVVAAERIPFLSDRHHFLFSWYGGWSPRNNWDNYSSLRLGGGPPVSETEDLKRPVFPGAAFNQFIAERYMITTVEYRYEAAFYFYLHLRGSFIWGKFGLLRMQEIDTRDFGTALSIGITSGFLWDSLLYLEYTLDDGFVHQGSAGHSILLSWSKQL